MPTKMVTIRSLSATVDANSVDGRNPFPTKECSEFDRSMHVSVTGLRLLGIPLDPAGITCPVFRYWSIIIGWIAFLGNLGGNLVILTDLISNQLLSTNTTTTSWNLLINKFNFVHRKFRRIFNIGNITILVLVC